MCPAVLHLLPIKDLKDLSVFFRRGYYRHAGPKGPEEIFSRGHSRGTGPRATVCHAASFHRRAWALGCHTRMRAGFPRRASVCPGNGLGWQVVFAQVECSRGTGPRATVKKRRALP